MTAARDGVDRFGTPAISASNTPPSESRFTSPPPQNRRAMSPDSGAAMAGNINENFRNIGKFFKRDMSSFGGRFGSSGGRGDSDG